MQPNNFTIYKSSAGSGKTFTLVKEYLALALKDTENPPKAYRHILAITFTNKAAFEMKERIVNALKELSLDEYSKLSFGASTLLKELKKHEKLNIDGGGVSLGHPVGASGARIVLHLCKILQRTNASQGMASLCIGGGQGGAMLIKNESVSSTNAEAA